MKTLFVSYNQAYNTEIVDILAKHGQRGYTQWQDIQGVGSTDGEPHLGSHAWPVLNIALLSVVPDNLVEPIMADLKETDLLHPELGLRAFSWAVEQSL